jgi:hypothetical protein
MRNKYHEIVLHGGEKCVWVAQVDRVTVEEFSQFWMASCKELVDGDEMDVVHLLGDKSPPWVHHYKFCPYCGREIDDGG